VRVVQRIGRRGLSSASIEGMLATSAPLLAVMDADLQHDERLLPRMLATLKNEGLDVVVGSRHVDTGGFGATSEHRERLSRFATRLSRLVLDVDLGDPMSGYFVVTRETFERVVRRLSGIGFKILLDIFTATPTPLRFRELPYTFRPRHAGESKLDSLVAWEYLMVLVDKKVGRYVPVRFVWFVLVGASGVAVHMGVLWVLFRLADVGFAASQAWATLTAMTTNFLLNNLLTYRDRRLRGRHLLRGWMSFVAACSVGALANVGIATQLFAETEAGWVLSALAGTLVGAVWNYAVSSVYTWGRPRSPVSTPGPGGRR
jgi:dolichol-phosphate mannosyltransferase